MRSHLRSHHPAAYNDIESKICAPKVNTEMDAETSGSSQSAARKRKVWDNQPKITDSIQRMTKYGKESTKYKSITDKITTLLVKQMLPTSLVDSDEWKELLHELDARYQCPSRKHFSTHAIPAKYTQVKERIMRDLSTATSISCTTDGWSSVNTDPYVSLTVHYLTPSWQLRTYCLRTIYMPESHTGENVAQMLKCILAEYNLYPNDIITFTTDNGANMKVAIRKLEAKRIPCFGHILHNAINNAIKGHSDIQDMLKQCRTLVSTLNHSFRLKSDLKKKQKEHDLPIKNLVGECSTRWGSKYDMVKRIFENKLPIQQLLNAERKYAKMTPTWDTWCVMEMFEATLRPFSTLTDAMSMEKSVGICSLYPLLEHIQRECQIEIDGEDISETRKGTSKTIRQNIWKYIDERYAGEKENGTEVMNLLKIATYMDPRLMTVVDEPTSELDESTRERVLVEAVALECHEEGESEISGEHVAELDSSALAPNDQSTPLMNLLLNSSTSSATEKEGGSEQAETRARKEIDYYCQIARSMISPAEDIAQWWATKGTQFPMIQRVAKRYLSTNPTSTASERLFSLAGNISTKKRNRIKPSNVDMLTCLAYNLKKNPNMLYES